ncbi:LysR family transcriptional regulator [Marivita sp. XM-24bin2]|uniref:LysR family transcriptional regulator n=1 Tax=unclassified Marivita TaxID=2632480 RepID=UPI0025C3E6C5|nr:LysR family transcriptional regulator [Marivita sp. XM-24bin2]
MAGAACKTLLFRKNSEITWLRPRASTCMNWNDLKIVLAIHRTGSVSGAARTLGIDQSTAARRLAAIERDVGETLFLRSPQGLTANDAGRVAVDEALVIEKRAERLLDRLPHKRGLPSGSVRLLSNPWLLTQLAAQGLSALRAEYPEIELVMIADTQRRGIAAGETDLSLWFELAPRDGEFATPICEVPYVVFAPEGRDPDAVPWMTVWNVKERIEPMRWVSNSVGLDVKFALKTNDPPALLAAIRAGLGKALIPACIGAVTPGVTRVPGIDPVKRRMHLHAHPDLVQTPRIQATMAWIRTVAPTAFADPGDITV